MRLRTKKHEIIITPGRSFFSTRSLISKAWRADVSNMILLKCRRQISPRSPARPQLAHNHNTSYHLFPCDKDISVTLSAFPCFPHIPITTCHDSYARTKFSIPSQTYKIMGSVLPHIFVFPMLNYNVPSKIMLQLHVSTAAS